MGSPPSLRPSLCLSFCLSLPLSLSLARSLWFIFKGKRLQADVLISGLGWLNKLYACKGFVAVVGSTNPER